MELNRLVQTELTRSRRWDRWPSPWTPLLRNPPCSWEQSEAFPPWKEAEPRSGALSTGGSKQTKRNSKEQLTGDFNSLESSVSGINHIPKQISWQLVDTSVFPGLFGASPPSSASPEKAAPVSGLEAQFVSPSVGKPCPSKMPMQPKNSIQDHTIVPHSRMLVRRLALTLPTCAATQLEIPSNAYQRAAFLHTPNLSRSVCNPTRLVFAADFVQLPQFTKLEPPVKGRSIHMYVYCIPNPETE